MGKEKNLRVGLIQQRCSTSKEDNLAASEAGIYEAARGGVKLVLLQELHTSIYFCQNENPAFFDFAEPIPGPLTSYFGHLAKKLDVVLIISLFEKRAAGLYHNTAVVLDRDGEIAGQYRKMHIPDDPGYLEKFYFTPGDLGFIPIRTSVARLGVLVCWDQWFPEAARLMALSGAELLLYPTAIGHNPGDQPLEQTRQLEAWTTIQRSHAVANGLHVLVSNRVGHEPDPMAATQGINFWGSSFIAGPQGEILAQAGDDAPEVIIADIDLGRNEDVRRWWPFLRDRRIDAYQGLEARFRD